MKNVYSITNLYSKNPLNVFSAALPLPLLSGKSNTSIASHRSCFQVRSRILPTRPPLLPPSLFASIGLLPDFPEAT